MHLPSTIGAVAWAWRHISDWMTHELSLAVRREGVVDMHPGVLVSKISVLWLSFFRASAGPVSQGPYWTEVCPLYSS